MGGKRVVQGVTAIGMAAPADLDALAQRDRHGLEQIAHDAVAAGQRDRLVEADVEIVEAPVGLRVIRHGRIGIVAHALQGVLDGGDAGAAGPLGRQCRALHFEREPNLDQVEKTLGIIVQHGGQEVGKSGAVRFAHHRPAAARQLEQPATRQQLDRLADGQPADSVALGQFSLARQAGAWRELGQDFIGQIICDRGGGAGLIGPVFTSRNRSNSQRYLIPLNCCGPYLAQLQQFLPQSAPPYRCSNQPASGALILLRQSKKYRDDANRCFTGLSDYPSVRPHGLGRVHGDSNVVRAGGLHADPSGDALRRRPDQMRRRAAPEVVAEWS